MREEKGVVLYKHLLLLKIESNTSSVLLLCSPQPSRGGEGRNDQ